MNRQDTQSFPLRISQEEHAALKTFAAVTGTSANEVARRAIREYLAGTARREEFETVLARSREQYAVALDKLADM